MSTLNSYPHSDFQLKLKDQPDLFRVAASQTALLPQTAAFMSVNELGSYISLVHIFLSLGLVKLFNGL